MFYYYVKTGCTFYFLFSLSQKFIQEIRSSCLNPELTFIRFASSLNVLGSAFVLIGLKSSLN